MLVDAPQQPQTANNYQQASGDSTQPRKQRKKRSKKVRHSATSTSMASTQLSSATMAALEARINAKLDAVLADVRSQHSRNFETMCNKVNWLADAVQQLMQTFALQAPATGLHATLPTAASPAAQLSAPAGPAPIGLAVNHG